ncbi:hypothetical protein FA15DRAFT_758489 [Coprinopsis marcescibilis]|uniref:Uncharacterized protein n=1 Tax=Coprinopsis marcescibilis TaxID=230819 RepID=A0A5C3KMT9_COPMA|nr:hypothetical protein FA15DRAFT_758489 [Coprinopsis marcescibilis]
MINKLGIPLVLLSIIIIQARKLRLSANYLTLHVCLASNKNTRMASTAAPVDQLLDPAHENGSQGVDIPPRGADQGVKDDEDEDGDDLSSVDPNNLSGRGPRNPQSHTTQSDGKKK